MELANKNISKELPELSHKLIILMATATGIAVANIYYIQPLLNQIAKYYGEIASAYSNGYFKLGFESGAIADLKIRNLVKKELIKQELAV
ncbi:MAG: hypothetical protein PWP67_1130 [Clostridium butyricum]|nr:hypothetical protein [Clostridium butyricum]